MENDDYDGSDSEYTSEEEGINEKVTKTKRLRNPKPPPKAKKPRKGKCFQYLFYLYLKIWKAANSNQSNDPYGVSKGKVEVEDFIYIGKAVRIIYNNLI